MVPLEPLRDEDPHVPLTYACIGDVDRVRRVVDSFPDQIWTAVGDALAVEGGVQVNYATLKAREQTQVFGGSQARIRTAAQMIAVDLTRIPDDEILEALIWRETLRLAQIWGGALQFKSWTPLMKDRNTLAETANVYRSLLFALPSTGEELPHIREDELNVVHEIETGFLDFDRETFLIQSGLIDPGEQWPILEDLLRQLSVIRSRPLSQKHLENAWRLVDEQAKRRAPERVLAGFSTLVLSSSTTILRVRWGRLGPILLAGGNTEIGERFLLADREIERRFLGRFSDDELLVRSLGALVTAGGDFHLAWGAWHEFARGLAACVLRELGPELGLSTAASSGASSRRQFTLRAEGAAPSGPAGRDVFGCEAGLAPRLRRALEALEPALAAAGFGGREAAIGTLSHEEILERVGASRVVCYVDKPSSILDLRRIDDVELRAHLAYAIVKTIHAERNNEPLFYEDWTLASVASAVGPLQEPLHHRVAGEVGLPQDQRSVIVAESYSGGGRYLGFVLESLSEADIERALFAFKLVSPEHALARAVGHALELEQLPPSQARRAEIEAVIKGAETRAVGIYAGALAAIEDAFFYVLRDFCRLGALSRYPEGQAAVERHRAANLARARSMVGPYFDEAAFETCWRSMIAADGNLPGTINSLVELALATARAVARATDGQ